MSDGVQGGVDWRTCWRQRKMISSEPEKA